MMKNANVPLVMVLIFVVSLSLAGTLPSNPSIPAFQSPPPAFLSEVNILPTPRPPAILTTNDVTLGQPSLTTSLNGYWQLNETDTGNRFDSSPIGSNTLTNINGVTWTAAGREGNAADFERDLNQHLKIESYEAVGLNFSNSFTLLGWVKRESLGDNMIMASKYEWGVSNRAYRFQMTYDDRLRLVVSPDGTTYSPDFYTTGGTQLQSTTVWYHVAAVFDSGAQQLRLYVNGALDAQKDVSYNSVYQSTAPFMLGGNLENGQVVQTFDGQMDEWRAYNRALSQSEIQKAMGGLKGYWPLDESDTGPRVDSSPFDNTLTNIGGVGWAAGQVNTASLLSNLTYTATHYLKIDDNQSTGLNVADSFTLVGWMKRNNSNAVDNIVMAGKYEWGVSNRAYRLELDLGNHLRFVVSPDGATYNSNFYALGSSHLDSTTDWYHVAGVFDAGAKQLRIYLDGNLEASKTVTYDFVNQNTAPFMLGANLENGQVVQGFDGLLDEWRIYDRVLSQNEIQGLMNE